MKARILLVHDNLPIVFAFKTVLERNNYLVAIANSETEAEKKLAADAFDLVITDLRLDGKIKGMTCFRWRESYRTSQQSHFSPPFQKRELRWTLRIFIPYW